MSSKSMFPELRENVATPIGWVGNNTSVEGREEEHGDLRRQFLNVKGRPRAALI